MWWYNLGIALYTLLVRITALFNHKAALFINGRRDFFRRYNGFQRDNRKLAWFHCASLGEFEQARPLIEQIDRTQFQVLVTFFSPSGYEIRKNYAHADLVTYLPMDTRRNARRFLALFRPDMAVFVKYEFWHHYLTALHRNRIPTFLVAAVFHPEQVFFRWYGKAFRKLLHIFTAIFVQDPRSLEQLKTVRTDDIYMAGDPRFDRVFATKQQNERFEWAELFKGNHRLLMLGSSWPAEEALAAGFIRQYHHEDLKLIIAPHDIRDERIAQILKTFAGQELVRYSELSQANLHTARILVIDNIGMLSRLYRYADIALVGGAFGKGLHNILEAAVFGIPVLYGPRIRKFREAQALAEVGGGFTVESEHSFNLIMENLLVDAEAYKKACQASAAFCEAQQGSAAFIMKTIMEQVNRS